MPPKTTSFLAATASLWEPIFSLFIKHYKALCHILEGNRASKLQRVSQDGTWVRFKVMRNRVEMQTPPFSNAKVNAEPPQLNWAATSHQTCWNGKGKLASTTPWFPGNAFQARRIRPGKPSMRGFWAPVESWQTNKLWDSFSTLPCDRAWDPPTPGWCLLVRFSFVALTCLSALCK